MISWVSLTDDTQLNFLKEKSFQKPQVLFKHSSRCSLSNVVLLRMGRSCELPAVDFYLLDLIRFRHLSHKIAADFDVNHESPQLLLIKNGNCVYHESHFGINMQELNEKIETLN